MDASARVDARDGFRPDIEGLRGIAVLLVVLFHGGLIALPGGFIGVDVFFVISGFLITGLLIREHDRSGTIRLRAFYARRVRRLLPGGDGRPVAAPSSRRSPFSRPSIARARPRMPPPRPSRSATSASRSPRATTSRRSPTPSPFLHFWSLAVEEQFYLVWPALILLAAHARRPRLGIGVMLGLVFAASLVANLVVSAVAVNWAFYSLPTRAWQLSLGGLIALCAVPLARIPGLVSAALAWLGLAALAGGGVPLRREPPVPGRIGARADPRGRGADQRGHDGARARASCWRAPRSGSSDGSATRSTCGTGRSSSCPRWRSRRSRRSRSALALAAVAVGAAWASWRFIEEPFRTGFPTLARYPGRTVLAGATAVVLVVTTAGGLALAAERDLGEPAYGDGSAAVGDWTASEDQPIGRSSPRPRTPVAGCAGRIPARRLLPPRPEPPAPAPVPATPAPTVAPVTYVRLPADIRPSLRNARTDEEQLRADGCLAAEGATKPRDCVYGDTSAAFTVALVGDSHAAQWFPALLEVAEARHWRAPDVREGRLPVRRPADPEHQAEARIHRVRRLPRRDDQAAHRSSSRT